MIELLRNSVLSVIFPQQCRVCSGQVADPKLGVACETCWADTRLFDGGEMTCEKCGAFFGDVAAPKAVRCHKCDDHHYDKAIAAGIYEKALSATVIEIKAVPKLPSFVIGLLGKAFDRSGFADADLVVPVPLSKQRRVERGFNQADILARAISRHAGISLDAASLARVTHSPIHRMGMDAKARELTVRKAFKVVRPNLIAGKSVLLIDDVLTSGSTASHCAAELKKAGANKVYVLTLARAVMS